MEIKVNKKNVFLFLGLLCILIGIIVGMVGLGTANGYGHVGQTIRELIYIRAFIFIIGGIIITQKAYFWKDDEMKDNK